jgi:hypothetical protein
MTPLTFGTRVRDLRTGLVGKIIRLFDCGAQGTLAVIRLDKEDPILGTITTAFEGEVEVLGDGEEKGVSE